MRKGNILLIVLAVVGVVAIFTIGYLWWQTKQAPAGPLTWEECLAQPKAIITAMYPGTCSLPDGRSVTQPISEEEQPQLPPPDNNTPEVTQTDLTCPESGWVDCMPILDEAKQQACSDEATVWYRQNCPTFQGLAM